MRVLPTAVLALLLASFPGVAGAATTANQTFKHGEANYRTYDGPIAFENYSGGDRMAPCPPPGAPTCSYEAHDFTIAPGDVDGTFSVSIVWASADNDWDLYVYKVKSDDSVDQDKPIASSAQGGTTEEVATLHQVDEPIAPGKYRIYVDNWQSGDPDFDWQGAIAFEPWVAPDKPPTAAFAAPDTAAGGQPVTLDASGSTDDAGIVNYAWDLDGDGRFETDAGTSPTYQATFQPGRRHVSLRVRDGKGASAFAARTIEVGPPTPGPGQTTPPATEPTLPPPPLGRIALDVRGRQRVSTVNRRGFLATIECPSTCTITGRLSISAATARRLGLGRRARTIATRVRTQSGRSFPTIRLKPARSVRRALRRGLPVSATLRVRVEAEGVAPQDYTRSVSIVA
jgi:PKD domain-containing protein